MQGFVAPTDVRWYRFLASQPGLDEVNFWRPSTFRRFHAPRFCPFFFKLKAPYNAICGFGYFVRYAALPYWLAWETFGVANGCADENAMRERISIIRERINFRGQAPTDHIGCIVLASVTLFPEAEWIPQPRDWPATNLIPMKYDLTQGEGLRIWVDARARVRAGSENAHHSEAGDPARYGTSRPIIPRLGQGAFRIEVTEAYERSCAMTGEHSLPALDAAHIQSYGEAGPHDVANGLLLRADLHRLFDKGYLTVAPDLRICVSPRLREDYDNGKTYYPLHGQMIRVPENVENHPGEQYLRWHNNRFK